MTKIDPVDLAAKLIRRPSVTPADEGALSVLIDAIKPMGFSATRLTFEEEGTPPVENLYARFGDTGPNFCFAGHTDVVPAGDDDAWSRTPFGGEQHDGVLWGRGAADMKGAIAAFVAAAAAAIQDGAVNGSISLLITGDEEGPAINGTKKLLTWLKEQQETIDHCLVGEPTNPAEMGDMVKVGRRGSINCWLTVSGKQGHVAYPDRAQNPIPALARKLLALSETPVDDGYERFQPSSLQVTDIHIGNAAHNVIPAKATARFNIRFNPNWTGKSIEQWIRRQLDAIASETGLDYALETIVSGEAFLTTDKDFIGLISQSVEAATGRHPTLSTSGGTSDARFIKDYAPVAEFGLVGETMHQVDERVAVSDIRQLRDIYRDILGRYFERFGTAQ